MNMFSNMKVLGCGVVVAANALVGFFLLFVLILGWAGGIFLTLGLWPAVTVPAFFIGVVMAPNSFDASK